MPQQNQWAIKEQETDALMTRLAMDPNTLSTKDLKNELQSNGLSRQGKRKELIERMEVELERQRLPVNAGKLPQMYFPTDATLHLETEHSLWMTILEMAAPSLCQALWCSWVCRAWKDHVRDMDLKVTEPYRATNDGTLRASLKALRGLRSLSLNGCKSLTDKGLQGLEKLPRLTELDVSHCGELTDDAVAEFITEVPTITSLRMDSVQTFTDETMCMLVDMEALTELEMTWCRELTDEGLEWITSLTNLTHLNLTGCIHITDVGVAHLAKLTGLQDLRLSYCTKIQTEGCRLLSTLPHLTQLSLIGCTTITHEGRLLLDHLKQRGCQVDLIGNHNGPPEGFLME